MRIALFLGVLIAAGGLYLTFNNGDHAASPIDEPAHSFEPERSVKDSIDGELRVPMSSVGDIPPGVDMKSSTPTDVPAETIENLLKKRGIPLFDSQGLPLSESRMLELRKTLMLRDLRFEVGNDEFGKRVDDLISSESVDQEWAQGANQDLYEWFDMDGSTDNFGECLSSVCYIDISATSSEYISQYMPRLRQWGHESVPGFLPMIYSYPTGDEFNRIYFFRDTFDPIDIGASPN